MIAFIDTVHIPNGDGHAEKIHGDKPSKKMGEPQIQVTLVDGHGEGSAARAQSD